MLVQNTVVSIHLVCNTLTIFVPQRLNLLCGFLDESSGHDPIGGDGPGQEISMKEYKYMYRSFMKLFVEWLN